MRNDIPPRPEGTGLPVDFPVRVCGYVRVSNSEQSEGYSLAAQRHAIEVFAVAHGGDVAHWYEDAGVSAHGEAIAKRPAFAAMLADAEAGRFDRVICHKLDRFSRRLSVTLDALARLERAGVGFVSITEQLDFASPIGKVALAMLGALAQYHSDNLSTEVKKGLVEKRRRGQHIGAIPYGSVRVDGHLRIDPARADDLRRVFTLAAALSTERAAEELNRLGIAPPRRAVAWSGSAVAYLRRTSGAWLREQGEPWAALYEAAATRPTLPVIRRADTLRLLTGLVRCACGGSVIYHSTFTLRDGTARRCGRCRDVRGRRGCRRWGRYMDELEAAVESWLFALPDPRGIVALPDDAGAAAALEARRGRLVRLYRDGVLGEAEYERERAELNRLRARSPATGARREEVGVGLALARESWSELHEETKRAFLAGLVDHFVADGGAIRPVWRPTVAAFWEDIDAGD